ncbi:MAG TPA: hypothetical protein VLB67_09970 [Acidimicrobiia bacterium]|nr:hypothetical protein [Acidimicrobiia bacterium]
MKIVRRTPLAVLILLSVACGPRPLEGVGERSGDWIGPVVNGVEFLPSSRPSGAEVSAGSQGS